MIDSSPMLQLNKAHWPVTVLGPGRRIGLWVQGCSIGCRGCVSQDTWARDESTSIAIGELLQWCRRVAPDGPDGITISGGEPFDQPEALDALLRGLAAWRREARLDFDTLCYSGYPMQKLRRNHAPLLEQLDAVIPEPFVEGRPITHVWRGSDNQSLVPLSPRGLRIFGPFVDAPADRGGKRMQVAIDAGRVWMIGIPARGDMQRVETLCADRGLALDKVSWRR